MNPNGSQKVERHSNGTRLRAVTRLSCAGLLLCVASNCAYAQNAAQRAALSQLIRRSASNNASNAIEATGVSLDRPGALAFDAAGNLYIADTDNNVIREVNLQGAITTVAGTGEQGSDGDGGPATSALLDSPAGVAVDASGNIYIADTHNNRIREVSGGTITTIAGTGVAGFSGDGSAAASATLDLPTAIAIDSKGKIFVADTNNHRIREISGTAISTVAGDGEQTYSGDSGPATAAGLDSPNGVAVDSAFNLYIGDTHNQRVRMVTFATGIISTVAGTGAKAFTSDGPATAAALARPRGVAVDATGIVYVADSDNNRIRTIADGTVSTIAGSGTEGYTGDQAASTSASLDTPRAVVVSGASIVFADTENNRVRTAMNGDVNTIAGNAANNAESISISGVPSAVYGAGSLTATFSNNNQSGTGTVTFYDGEGSTPALVGTASLSSNTAVLNTSGLSAGTHFLIASYAGDANNPAVVSGVFVYTVAPAPLTAVAAGANMLYGQSAPTLTGTLTGVLPQDSGKVAANFTTTATSNSSPGTYPIAVSLAGAASGNYSVALGSGSGSVVIAQAPSTTTLAATSSTPAFGTNLTLAATVASTTSGTPTGSVSFYNGSTLLNGTPIALSNGVASVTLNSLPVGSFALTATYSGDKDFVASSSASLAGSVLSPDFTIAASPASQAILPDHAADYSITVTPTNATFLYPVTLSVSGLPAGVTATFNPSSIASGASSTTTTLTLAATAQAGLGELPRPWRRTSTALAFTFILLPFAFGKRSRRSARKLSRSSRIFIALLALAVLGSLAGCGDAGFFNHANRTYTITVTATSGPNTHTTNVALSVQ